MSANRLLLLWTLLGLVLVIGWQPAAPGLDLSGAWVCHLTDGTLPEVTAVRIFSKGYMMEARYVSSGGAFVSAVGGPYQWQSGRLVLTTDFDTRDSLRVGSAETWKVTELAVDRIRLTRQAEDTRHVEVWERLDDGQAPLAGDWRIWSRLGDDSLMHEMKPGPRKTIKILSGTRFQWTAMNTETRQFLGTGGGTYVFENGVYTEKIEFFSRDVSRVGATLSFQGSVTGDDWTHSGKSSRGQYIREVWRRE
ncbi:MAG: membrane or secreted protein [Bacteroidia bacterium]|nr:membrane or secreted protein [Bacteroidia bacterium]